MATGNWLGVSWIGVLALASAGADAPADDLKKLQGTWNITSVTRDGKELAELKGAQMTFVGKDVIIKKGEGKRDEFPYDYPMPVQLRPTKKPKEIDIRLFPAGGWFGSDVNMRGIYELDGDTFRFCVGNDNKRPKTFSDKGSALLVLERQKK